MNEENIILSINKKLLINTLRNVFEQENDLHALNTSGNIWYGIEHFVITYQNEPTKNVMFHA